MKKFYKKKWKCLVCGAVGWKLQTSWKANRAGRQHIYEYHKGNGELSILKLDFMIEKQQRDSKIRKKKATHP
jgi:hypothetical protein